MKINDKEFDKLLKKTLEVSVPENLENRILENTYEKTTPFYIRLKNNYKKTISAVLVLFSMIFSTLFIPLHSSMEEEIINEIQHKHYFNEKIDNNTSSYKKFDYLLNKEFFSNISNLHPCKTKGFEGIHFILNDLIIHYFPNYQHQPNVDFIKDYHISSLVNESGSFIIISKNKDSINIFSNILKNSFK